MSILLLLSFFLFFLLHPSPSSAEFQHFCDDFGNFTANSIYETNLNQILSAIPTDPALSSGFSKSIFGSIPDQVYALALCRGDTNSSACRSCVHVATHDASQLCPYYKSVTIYYDPCLLSYSNRVFLNSTDNSHPVYASSSNKVSDSTLFDEFVNYLMNKTADSASYNSSDKVRYSTAQVRYEKENYTIYGLEQCTPDITEDECRKCLGDLIKSMPQRFSGWQGGRILGVRCNLRYEVYTFYYGASKLLLEPPTAENAPSPAPTVHQPETPASPREGTKAPTKIIAIVVVSVVVAAASLIFALSVIYSRRKKVVRRNTISGDEHEIMNSEFQVFDFGTLKGATRNFSDANKLGEGGFGPVYKGTLQDGQEVAVKRLSCTSGQGLVELRNEVVLLAKLQHKNLVRVLGFCLQDKEKLLVYEYLPQKSLDKLLFDSSRRKELNWGSRYKIIEGISRGLLYLHEDSRLKVIHRDLKVSNILLDEEMNPKISDFGLAKLVSANETQQNTCRIAGTYGYMAPEYALHGYYSTKSDVFSYGVLVLEILTGRRNSCQESGGKVVDLLSYVWQHWTERKATEIIDKSIVADCQLQVVSRCIHIGLLCVQEDPSERPSMASIVLMLSSSSMTLPTPKPPTFLLRGGMISEVNISQTETTIDISRSEHSTGAR